MKKSDDNKMIENSRIFPTISLVIPVYNSERTLGACLESAIGQAYGNYDIVIVNNNANAATAAIIDEYAKKSSKIKVVVEGRRGRGSARNAGVAAATGVIIAMTDSDCILPPQWLHDISAPIRAGQESVVMGFEDDAIGNYWTKCRQQADFDHCMLQTKDGYINHFDSKNFAIAAPLAKEIPFDPRFTSCEDFDFFLRLRLAAKIRFIPSIRVLHHHDASARELAVTEWSRARSIQQIIRAHKNDPKIADHFKSAHIDPDSFLRSLILFPLRAVMLAVQSPRRIPFAAISETAWKMGALSGILAR